MVFQYSALFDSLNVFDNISFALQERKEFRKKYTKAELKEIVRKKPTNRWLLTDEFSGYILDNRHQISEELLKKEVVPMKEYMEYYKKLSV